MAAAAACRALTAASASLRAPATLPFMLRSRFATASRYSTPLRRASGTARPAPRFVLAVDQGTTSTRCIVFDRDGAVVASHQREHTQYFPGAALVEHDADEIYARVGECAAGALAAARCTAADVAALGITNQRETIVVWDRRSGRPLHRALVWQDQRGAPLCAAVAGDDADRFRAKTGLPIVPYFSASKLAWLLDNVPGLRAQAEAGEALFGTIDCFLLWRLTGGAVHATDVSNASRTLLLDIRSLQWDDELLTAFRIPRAMLPQVRPSSTRLGICGPATVGAGGNGSGSALDAAARPIACLEGVTVGGMLGDQQAALFGQACFEPGDAKNTYGTGCFLLMNTGGRDVASRHGLLSTVAYQLGAVNGGAGTPQPPVYALEGSVSVGGAIISWLKNNVGLLASAGESEAVAASVPDSGGCAFVPAFNGLFAPHWRSDARGVMTGLSGHTTRGHIVRAALEAVAFQSFEIVLAMQKDRDADAAAACAAGSARMGAAESAGPAPPLRVDGGMTANSLLMQFQSDITGRDVVRPVVAETTALGAAYAAGLAVGFWRDLDELRSHWKADRTWTPTMPRGEAASRIEAWERAVAKSLP